MEKEKKTNKSLVCEQRHKRCTSYLGLIKGYYFSTEKNEKYFEFNNSYKYFLIINIFLLFQAYDLFLASHSEDCHFSASFSSLLFLCALSVYFVPR